MDLRHVAFACVACTACASEDGLPVGGDVTLTINGEPVVPGFGAVISGQTDPPTAMIILGTRDINCATRLDDALRKGTYLTMLVDPEAGTQPAVMVSMIRVTSSGTLINGAADVVMIDAFDGRVTGSVNFATTDDIDGVITTLAAAGTFDVESCL
jgi:hypothetical protein